MASIPQKTHGQNGIIGHSAARLLSWFCSPYKLFVQVARLMAMVFTRVLSDEWTSEKRKVDSSILSLTTDSDQRIFALSCENPVGRGWLPPPFDGR